MVALSSLKIVSVINLESYKQQRQRQKPLPIIFSTVRESAFDSLISEMVQASLGLLLTLELTSELSFVASGCWI